MPGYAGLDLLASAVLLAGPDGTIVFVNTALEDLLNTSRRTLEGQSIAQVFGEGELFALFRQAREYRFDEKRQDVTLAVSSRDPLTVHSTVVSLHEPGLAALFEFQIGRAHV